MNRCKSRQWILYLLAILFTLALILTSVTAAQDNGGTRQEKPSSVQAGSSWKQDGPNVYIEGGNVGIGARPSELGNVVNANGDAVLLLKTPNDMKSGIFLREHDKNHGFNVTFDGSVVNPGDHSSSGLFGIWRVEGNDQAIAPALSIYRHINTVGIGIEPEAVTPNISLRVLGTIKIDDGELDEDAQGNPLPGIGENNYGLIGQYKTSQDQPEIFAIRSYGSYQGQSIRLQQQIGPDTYDRIVISPDGEICLGSGC